MEERPPGDPERGFDDLRKGSAFSIKLMNTYNFVILGIVLLVGIVHWHGQIAGWRRRRTARLIEKANNAYDEDPLVRIISSESAMELNLSASETSSSVSSTVNVGLAPDTVEITDDEEDSPMLAFKSRRRRFPWIIVDSIRGFLAYQPRPIPFFNKTLPANDSTLAGILFIALNFFYLFFNIHFKKPDVDVIILSHRASLVFIVNLPLLYLFSAKTQPLSFITGYSYESLNILHRRLGELLCLSAFIHGSLMFAGFFTLFRYVGFTLYTFIVNRTVLTGISALIVYETLYFTSLASFRARWYELFLGIHIIFQVAALALLFFHDRNTRPYVGAAVGIFVLDRLMYRIGMKSTTIIADVSVAEDGQTVILSASIPYRAPSLLPKALGHDITHGWRATDHVFLTCPTLAPKHILQAHPFTILSPSPRSLVPSLTPGDVMQLDLLIRAHDGFTSDLLKHALVNRSLKIRLDGPYGGSHARDALEGASQAILVAGGSGIAVVWPLVHFLLSRSPLSSDVEFASKERMQQQRITFIWVVQKASHLSWLSAKEIEEVRSMDVEVIIPPPTEEKGRPDLRGMIVERVGEMEGNGRTSVVASGPDEMGRGVRNACAELVGRGERVGVVVEKFGW